MLHRIWLESLYIFKKAIELELEKNIIPIDTKEFKLIIDELEENEYSLTSDKSDENVLVVGNRYRYLYDFTLITEKYYDAKIRQALFRN